MSNDKKSEAIKISVKVGSARQLGKKKFYWRYRGKGHDKTIYAKSKLELEDKAQEYLRLVHLDIENELLLMTLSEFIDYFNLQIREKNIADSTSELYVQINRDYIKNSIIDKKITDLKTTDLQFYFNIMADTSYYATLIRIRGIINQALLHALDIEMIKKSPIEKVKFPKESQCKQKEEVQLVYFDKREFFEFYNIVLNDKKIDIRLKTFILLLLFSGARGNEALGLTWDRVDFNENRIHITKQVRRVKIGDDKSNSKTKLKLLGLKTKNSKRYIPIEPKIMDQLMKLKEFQKEQIKNSFGLYEENNFVFATEVGKAIDLTNERKRFKRFLLRNNIRVVTKDNKQVSEITFHCLRHSYITLLYHLGVDWKTLSELAGHFDSFTTEKIYTHIADTEKRNAANMILPSLSES